MLDGTVVFSCRLCTTGELLNEPISSIVERINKAVERVNEDHGWSRINHMDMHGFEELALSTLQISWWTELAYGNTDFRWREPRQFEAGDLLGRVGKMGHLPGRMFTQNGKKWRVSTSLVMQLTKHLVRGLTVTERTFIFILLFWPNSGLLLGGEYWRWQKALFTCSLHFFPFFTSLFVVLLHTISCPPHSSVWLWRGCMRMRYLFGSCDHFRDDFGTIVNLLFSTFLFKKQRYSKDHITRRTTVHRSNWNYWKFWNWLCNLQKKFRGQRCHYPKFWLEGCRISIGQCQQSTWPCSVMPNSSLVSEN